MAAAKPVSVFVEFEHVMSFCLFHDLKIYLQMQNATYLRYIFFECRNRETEDAFRLYRQETTP